MAIAFGMQGKSQAQGKKPAAKETGYVCPKCRGFASQKAAKCPPCKVDLVKGDVGYYCEKCGARAKAPGECKKCKSKLAKGVAVYHCDKCGKDSVKGGNC
jgi:predicted RNA-binding Zn-ribbon protein involved in translation (DUF1610 family)